MSQENSGPLVIERAVPYVPYNSHHIAAIHVFAAIAEAWELTESETAGLLGVEAAAWYFLKSTMLMTPRTGTEWTEMESVTSPQNGGTDQSDSSKALLSAEQLACVHDIYAIYVMLRRMAVESVANRWVTQENPKPLFGDKAPIRVMVEGGFAKVGQVRDHLEIEMGG